MKEIVQELLLLADIQINGMRPWDLRVYNEKFYSRLAKNVDLAFGESYMDGWWDCQRLDELFFRLMRSDIKAKAISHPRFWRSLVLQNLFETLRGLFNFQSKNRAFIVGVKQLRH